MFEINKFIQRFIKNHILYFIGALLLIILSSLMQIYPVQYMSLIIDGLTNKLHFGQIINLIVLWYLFRIIGFIFGTLSGILVSKLSSNFSSNIRNIFFDKALHSNFIKVEDSNISQSVSVLVDDINSMGNIIILPLKYIGEDIFTFLWAVYFLTKIDLNLFLLCMPLGVIMLIVGNKITSKTKKLYAIKRSEETLMTKIYY